MRRRLLALFFSFASPALAQAPATPAPAPTEQAPAPTAPAPTPAAPAPTPAAPAPTKPAPTPAPTGPSLALPQDLPKRPMDETPFPELPREERIRRDIQEDSRFLFQSLITGDVRSVSNELFYPFQLEDKRYATPEELVMAWVKQLRLKRTDLITLYDIEVLPLVEMEKKYGKAPARLGLDLRNEKDLWFAVGNLSGHPAVFIYRPYRDEFRAFAYTD
jgi:hypothetical protein